METLTTAQLIGILRTSHIPEEVETAIDILSERLQMEEVYKEEVETALDILSERLPMEEVYKFYYKFY